MNTFRSTSKDVTLGFKVQNFFAKRTYIKAKVLENSMYKTIKAHYIGCDINGNPIIQDDYIVEIQRFNNFII